MARQADAERERRTKVINAIGEHEAVHDASRILAASSSGLHLRYLQTLFEPFRLAVDGQAMAVRARAASGLRMVIRETPIP